ncbi:MAG: hypothetical protein U0132_19840 [Gemmatimonadaceae bacterium]
MRRLKFLVMLSALALLPLSAVRAQVGISFWAGYAQSSDSGAAKLDTKGIQAAAQLALPLVPIAFRAEATQWGTSINMDHLNVIGSGVVQLRLPLLQIYGIAGYGRFAETDSTTLKGWAAGGGVRLGQGRFGLFGEVRRFDVVARTVTTLGITF